MSYSKTSPQPPGLDASETCVTLDSGQLVAVSATSAVADGTGNMAITGAARQIDATGQPVTDANGQPIACAFSYGATQADVTVCGSVQALQKCVLMALLGEPTGPLWTDPLHAQMLSDASIRTRIASAAHAGTIDTVALL